MFTVEERAGVGGGRYQKRERDEWKAHRRPKGRECGLQSTEGLNVGQREEERRRRKSREEAAGSWFVGGRGREGERRAYLKEIPSGKLSFLYKFKARLH